MKETENFDEFLTKSMLEYARENSLKFHSLNRYVNKEFSEGKREFRLVVSDNGDAYIHPMGKDGETHDFKFNLDNK